MARLGAVLVPGADIHEGVRHAQLAEQLGYESAWVTHGVARDAFVVLTAYAAATQRLKLGTDIVPIYPRQPTVMAQQALALNEFSRGRFILGLGVSHRNSMEGALGLDMGKPFAVMQEYVAVLRQAFTTGTVKHQGDRYHIDWSYGVSPLPPAPPIMLAALAPRMVETAARISEGALLWLAPPEYVRDVVVPAARRGCEKAGKDPASFEIVCPVPAAVVDDPGPTWQAFRSDLVRYLSQPFYQNQFRLAGYGEEVDAFLRDRERGDPGQAVPMRFAEAVGMVGSAARVRDLVERYRDAGVTLPILRPFHAPSLERTLREVGE